MEREDETEQEEREPTHVITELEVFKVDLVSSPATRDKFLMIRSTESEDEPMPKRRAFSSEQFERLRIGQEGQTIVATQAGGVPSIPVERAVPKQDATSDAKRKSQKKRSEKYGIEAWEDKGENLSFPKGDPTTESLYGDPVQLKYPLGYDDNKVSLKRANNARARFKQAFARYEKTKSRKVIHTRIVKAQLKAGANPAYDPDDANDKLLPKELRDKMKQPVKRNEATEDEEMANKELDATVSRLGTIVERMESVFAGVIATAEAVAPEGTAPAPEPAPEGEPEPEGEPSEDDDTQPEGSVPVAPEGTVVAPEPAPVPAPEPVAPEGTAPAPEPAPVPAPEPVVPEGTAPASEPVVPEGTAPASEPVVPEGTAPASEPAPVPEPAPAPAVPESDAVTALAGNMEKLGGIMERFASETKATLATLGGRVEHVERSLRTGNSVPQDETDEPETLERGENGKPIFAGLIFPDNG